MKKVLLGKGLLFIALAFYLPPVHAFMLRKVFHSSLYDYNSNNIPEFMYCVFPMIGNVFAYIYLMFSNMDSKKKNPATLYLALSSGYLALRLANSMYALF